MTGMRQAESELRNVNHSVCYLYSNDNVAYLYGMSKIFHRYEYKRDRCNINSQPASFALSMPENQISKGGSIKAGAIRGISRQRAEQTCTALI